MTDHRDRDPGLPRLPWPPLVFVLALAVGFLNLDSGAFGGPWTLYLATAGWLLLLIGVMLEISAYRILKRSQTPVSPTADARVLVTCGPYALMRHPIYFGNVTILIGLGMVFCAPSFLVAGPIAGVAVRFLAAAPEERRLARQFGKDWERYAADTSRWLFF